MPTFSAAAGIGGSFSLPAGGDQIASVPLGPTGIVIAGGVPVQVVISGGISRQATAGLKLMCTLERFVDLCATDWADLVAETPIPPAGLRGVYARAFASWAGAQPGDMEGDGDLSLTGPSGGELYAGRGGWECYYSYRLPDVSERQTGPCHTFGGGHVVTVQPNDGGGTLVLSASSTQLPVTGGSVSFQLGATDGSTPTDVSWEYVEDAPPAPPPVATARPDVAPADVEAVVAAAAERGNVFTMDRAGHLVPGRPVHGGILLVRASTEVAPHARADAGHSGFASASPSKASAANTCTGELSCTIAITATGTMVARATVAGVELSASARVQVGGGGAGGSAELELSCPASVMRATEVTCTASGTPASATLAVTGWRFHPDDTHLADIERSSGEENLTWSGKMVTSGIVTVTATLNGNAAEKSAHIAVSNRAPLIVDFAAPAMSDDADMSERPYQTADEEGLFHLGHIHVGDYGLRIPGNVDVVADGPNAGLAYFLANPYEPRWVVHINLSQLQPNSALAQLQRVGPPAFESVQSCLRSQLPSLVAPIAEHEGTTMHPKSHAGRYAARFNELAGPAIERLVVQQDLGAAVAAALAPVLQAADQESKGADTDFRPSLCRLTLFLAPR